VSENRKHLPCTIFLRIAFGIESTVRFHGCQKYFGCEEFMSIEKNRESWNKLSAHYQSNNRISLSNVHYGPFGPGEKELKMFGDVKGLDVLELGCGGGQNAIVIAAGNAKSVTGMDQSEEQVKFARKLAQQNNVEVRFIIGNIEDLSVFDDNSFDLIISSHALGYVEHIDSVFSETARVLRPKGRCVLCLEHPVMCVLLEALEEDDFSKMQDYFVEDRQAWNWDDNDGNIIAEFESTPWTFGQIINGLISSGFAIERIEEPPAYSLEQIEEIGWENVPYTFGFGDTKKQKKFTEICRRVPYSLIVAAVLFSNS
jgi:ubiquinone/menaquinone biosynthesis C-methylase UbiE